MVAMVTKTYDIKLITDDFTKRSQFGGYSLNVVRVIDLTFNINTGSSISPPPFRSRPS